MIKKFIFRKILPTLIIVYGAMYLVNYLDISPEVQKIKKLSNDIVNTISKGFLISLVLIFGCFTNLSFA